MGSAQPYYSVQQIEWYDLVISMYTLTLTSKNIQKSMSLEKWDQHNHITLYRKLNGMILFVTETRFQFL
jgi:hypothetical protein